MIVDKAALVRLAAYAGTNGQRMPNFGLKLSTDVLYAINTAYTNARYHRVMKK